MPFNREDYLVFFANVLKAIQEREDEGLAYQLLEENIDKLDGDLAKILSETLTATLPTLELDQLQGWIELIASFCIAVKNFPHGNKADNLEIAIVVEELLEVFIDSHTSPVKWTIHQINLGNSYDERIRGVELDNRRVAISHYKAALEVLTSEYYPELWACAQGNLGITYCKLNDDDYESNIEQGISAIYSALQVYSYEKFPENWALFQKNLGWAYGLRVEGSKFENSYAALIAYGQSLRVYTPETSFEEWADVKKSMGRIYRDVGEFKEAIHCCKSVLAASKISSHLNNLRETGHLLGEIAFAAETWEEAAAGYGIAIEIVEYSRIHNRIDSESAAHIFSSSIAVEVYDKMIKACIKLGQFGRALEYVERNKTRNWIELLYSNVFNPKGDFTSQLLVRYRRLLQEIYLRFHLLSVQNIKNRIGIYSENCKEAACLNELKKEFNKLINSNLETFNIAFDLEALIEPLTFEKIKSLLPDSQTCIINWYVASDVFFTFITSPISEEPTVILSSLEERETLRSFINEYVGEYLDNKPSWSNQLEDYLRELAGILKIDLIISYLPANCKQLVLIPYWFLHLFPLHSLPINRISKLYLLDSFERGIRYSPSCQLIRQVKQQNNVNFAHLFAIQNPTGDLIYSELEVDIIKSLFKSVDVLTKNDAEIAAINSTRLSSAHCIHFSGHASFNFSQAFQEGLILKNGKLDVFGILSLNLKQCCLVTLSACETGLTNVKFFTSTGGDEFFGLVGSFLAAGASSVVSSLWTVSDLSTAFLMIRCYEELMQISVLKEGSVAIAINKAQKWLRSLKTEEFEELLVSYNSQITQLFAQMPEDERLIAEASLERIRNRKPYPFTNPYYWAAFVAIGL